jgi:hypothetical protein
MKQSSGAILCNVLGFFYYPVYVHLGTTEMYLPNLTIEGFLEYLYLVQPRVFTLPKYCKAEYIVSCWP